MSNIQEFIRENPKETQRLLGIDAEQLEKLIKPDS